METSWGAKRSRGLLDQSLPSFSEQGPESFIPAFVNVWEFQCEFNHLKILCFAEYASTQPCHCYAMRRRAHTFNAVTGLHFASFHGIEVVTQPAGHQKLAAEVFTPNPDGKFGTRNTWLCHFH